MEGLTDHVFGPGVADDLPRDHDGYRCNAISEISPQSIINGRRKAREKRNEGESEIKEGKKSKSALLP